MCGQEQILGSSNLIHRPSLLGVNGLQDNTCFVQYHLLGSVLVKMRSRPKHTMDEGGASFLAGRVVRYCCLLVSNLVLSDR
jgi:hypothetical protein